ncbi:glycosyltransferase family 2 protein [Anaerotardibacter muris]|uniref:glycosyltransferase family 2 protein n=1 Tax=Anaerotardibacter muris TaxID=2941505 RepID=UPI00203DD5DD|nr:glycosyltransferase family 2 protein [Anaerotardibacter muris]
MTTTPQQTIGSEDAPFGTAPAISIIIPVYNVRAWLERAVKSLQAQTFSDFELFLIDDGSTDGSGEVCDQLAVRDARIRVIHQENAGAAAARNLAIEQARGEYLYFMDGDDWVDPTALADMYEFAKANDLDLVVTGFYIETYYSDDKFYQELRNAPDRVFASQDEFRQSAHELFDAQLLYAPWNKLYRRAYLMEKGIRFPATFWDDLPFNLDVVREVERVGTLDGHYYHFLRARQESENTRYRADMYEKREEEHQWLQELYTQWGIDSPKIQEFLARRYAERLVGCVENITNKNCTLSRQEKRAQIAHMISTPQARDALAKTVPGTFMMKVLFVPYRMQNVTLVMAESGFISFVKQRSTNLFARLKANR